MMMMGGRLRRIGLMLLLSLLLQSCNNNNGANVAHAFVFRGFSTSSLSISAITRYFRGSNSHVLTSSSANRSKVRQRTTTTTHAHNKPYVLQNNHCLSTAAKAATSSPTRLASVAEMSSSSVAAAGGGASTSSSSSQSSLQRTVTVELGDRAYPIYIGTGLLEDGELLRKHVTSKRALVITNDRVGPIYLDKTVKVLEAGGVKVDTVVLPDGEEYKSFDQLMKIMDKALETRQDRTTTFVALGGGVIGDMVGFAAAIYQRGVKFVQVPTTLMAMVDSAVGGKTAVNHPLGKNMIGAFYQPQCVLVDINTLDTLPERELASGIAEIIKYGLIRDPSFFEWQEKVMRGIVGRDPELLAEAVERSCINKAEVVASDEKEAGLRATLNLGHTFGHAIETGLGYGALLHGEAVAIGTHMAAVMSQRLGWITQDLVDRTVEILKEANLPTELPAGGGMDMDKFLNAMAVDKKVSGGKLRLILLKGDLGKCVFTGDYDVEKMKETIAEFCARQ